MVPLEGYGSGIIAGRGCLHSNGSEAFPADMYGLSTFQPQTPHRSLPCNRAFRLQRSRFSDDARYISSVASPFTGGTRYAQNMSPTPDETSANAIGHASPKPPPRKRLAASKWIFLAGFFSFVTLYWITSSYLGIQADLGRWGCRMSWMSPNYVRLTGPFGSGLRGLERKYGLWLYREGGLQPDVQVSG